MPVAGLFVAVLLNLGLLWFFHNRYWCPADDGVFAHVAERILHGEVLHRDVQEAHPGLVNFINALMLRIFGVDFVSLRYPLVFMTVIEAAISYRLILPLGVAAAIAASFVPAAMGLLNFINPNPHWYSVFFLFLIIATFSWVPAGNRLRLPLTGLLLGLIMLTRQLSGCLAALGVFAFLYWENRQDAPLKKFSAGRILLAVAAGGLGWYLWKASDGSGYVLIGMWPLSVLGLLLTRGTVEDAALQRICIGLAMGIALAFIPLLGYHAATHSLDWWWRDAVGLALQHLDQPFLSFYKFVDLFKGGWGLLLHPAGPTDLLNGIFWIVVPLFSLLNGVWLIGTLYRRPPQLRPAELALPMLAAFHSVVSLHNQIPIYLFFSIGLSLLGFLKLSLIPARPVVRNWTVAGVAFLCAVAIYFQGGQSFTRGFGGIVKGVRVPWADAGGRVPRLDLYTDESFIRTYSQMIAFIQSNTRPAESIFVFPNNAEVYFLAQRRNPFRFFSADLGITDEAEYRKVLQTFQSAPPRCVVFLSADKRNTVYTLRLLEFIQRRYRFAKRAGLFEIYVWPQVGR